MSVEDELTRSVLADESEKHIAAEELMRKVNTIKTAKTLIVFFI